ncbi:MAG: FAD-binding oxidoreductase, partial [Pseudomonadota bacterium]|nr:FAD-binding oxidoreductase [Pseudomonadota bacterium]
LGTPRDNMQTTPFWWEEAPRQQIPEEALPSSVDVAIVGSGYTGISAALTLSRAGRSVLVLESGDIGHGASTRNGGQVGADYKTVLDRFKVNQDSGKQQAAHAQRWACFDYLTHLIEAEGIDCQFERVGRFVGAYKPAHYDSLARDLDAAKASLGVEGHAVSRGEVHHELGTERYFGGIVLPRDASLHPGLLHQGMLERALEGDTRLAPRTTVRGVEISGSGFTVSTNRGSVAARQVLIATNGYTGAATPGLRRGVIPVGSYMIATDEVDPAAMARIMPKGRVNSDSRKVVFYYRPSHDRRRVLIGGRVASGDVNERLSARRLHAVLADIFPDLADVGVSHAWMGFVAYTFDHKAHLGVHDGLHYAMGYCGGGVHQATYFGHCAAQKILGVPDGETGIAESALPTRPYYWGTPWFVPLAVIRYKITDRWGI